MSYRFRTGAEGELVLQVSEHDANPYAYGARVKWRDATVGDIPVTDPFRAMLQADGRDDVPAWIGPS